MLEKDIENIIAQYPDEFFPESKLKLVGQQVKLGTCYADIIFSDKYDRTIIIEVKRGILSRDGAGQIMEYYGLLKQQDPAKVIELILCANVIPHERKLFLENAGIECKELGLSLIQTIAQKHSYEFLDTAEKKQAKIVVQETALPYAETKLFFPPGQCTWIFQANPNRYDIFNALSDPELDRQCWQVNQHKHKIKKGNIALIWMSGREAGIYAVAEIVSDPLIMADFPAEEKYWVSEGDRGKKRLKVIISIRQNMVNTPVFRYELKSIEGLKNLSILRFYQGTNFAVSKDEWEIIKKKIEEKLPKKLK